MSRVRTSLVLLLLLGSFDVVTASEPHNEATEATIHLASGRTFTAAIDRQTTDQTLWLRFDGTTAVLYRPVAWNTVAAIEYAGQRVEDQQMRELANSLKNERQTAAERSDAPTASKDASVEEVPAEQVPTATHAEIAEHILAFPPRVQTVHIDAYVANWDADVELDGIVLAINTIDAYGHSVPARGTVRAELRVERRSRLRPQPRRIRADFDRIGYWTKALTPEHGDGVFLLPFQAIHPEFDHASATHGLLNVRVSIPGQGDFEDSIADLTVRPYSRIRNQIQDTRGTRFLPVERTSRAK